MLHAIRAVKLSQNTGFVCFLRSLAVAPSICKHAQTTDLNIGIILRARGGVRRKQKANEREEKAKELTSCRRGIRLFTSRVIADSRIMSS